MNKEKTKMVYKATSLKQPRASINRCGIICLNVLDLRSDEFSGKHPLKRYFGSFLMLKLSTSTLKIEHQSTH